MASNSSSSRPEIMQRSDFVGHDESERDLVEFMSAQFGRRLSPDVALDLHQRSSRIRKI